MSRLLRDREGVVREPESAALRAHLRRRRPLVSSALARTEVAPALLHLGERLIARGHDVLVRIELWFYDVPANAPQVTEIRAGSSTWTIG